MKILQIKFYWKSSLCLNIWYVIPISTICQFSFRHPCFLWPNIVLKCPHDVDGLMFYVLYDMCLQKSLSFFLILFAKSCPAHWSQTLFAKSCPAHWSQTWIDKQFYEQKSERFVAMLKCGARVFRCALRSTGSTDCVENGLISLLHWDSWIRLRSRLCGERVNIIVALYLGIPEYGCVRLCGRCAVRAFHRA